MGKRYPKAYYRFTLIPLLHFIRVINILTPKQGMARKISIWFYRTKSILRHGNLANTKNICSY